MGDESTPGVSGRGRTILLGLGAGGVLLGGLLGLFVGANGGETLTEVTLLGILTVPVSPAAMTLYGMAVIGIAVGLLYGAVSLASRFDTNAR